MNFYALSANIGGLMAGLALLWLAGDRVVRYAIAMATKLKVTKFFIGFIVLAIAAGIPELAVAISAAFSKVSEVSAGDIIGANFSDIGMVTGLVLTIAGSISMKRSDRLKLINLLLVAMVVMALVYALGFVGKVSGCALVFFYGVALYVIRGKIQSDDIWHEEVEAITHEIADEKDKVLTSLSGIIVKLLMSIGVVLGCSWLTVHCAVEFATLFGAQLETVGATICAIGTSLPELAMSLTALKRKEYDLALAPTLGSVLEHSMLVLGVLGLCSHHPVSFAALRGAGLFMFAGFAVMILFLWLRRPLARWQGVVLLTLYAFYLAYELGWLGAW